MSAWYPMARAYKWNIKFDGYSDPFPASASSDVWQSIMNGTVDYLPDGFAYPERAKRGDFSVTAHEIKDHQLQDYFVEWREEISDGGLTIALLAKAAREIVLTPLKLDNGVISNAQVTLVVIPDGQITYEYTSDKNSGLSAAISFKVVGE